MNETEVLIVGAGAAGLTAARAAKAAGLAFIVIEASGRIGGRAYTERGSLGTAFDHGAHYLHSASENPFRRYAEEAGFAYRKGGYVPMIWDGSWWGASAHDDFFRKAQDGIAAIEAAADADNRQSARSSVPQALAEDRLFRGFYEEFLGAGMDDVAAGEHKRYSDSYEDWPLAEGYGALVAHYGAEVPVTLDCAATRIDHGGQPIRVETTRGTIRAQHVIVTVSTGVLAAGSLRFSPELSAARQAAIAGTPMGYAGKIAFTLQTAVPDLPEHQGLVLAKSGLFANVVVKGFGAPTVTLIVGGPDWEDIERTGSDAMIAVARELVSETYGTALTGVFGRAATTGWLGDPNVLGGHSYVRAGAGRAREVLAEPIDERLHFAGEAVSSEAWATVHGAAASAEACIRRIVEGPRA